MAIVEGVPATGYFAKNQCYEMAVKYMSRLTGWCFSQNFGQCTKEQEIYKFRLLPNKYKMVDGKLLEDVVNVRILR